ncbi:hypothetical protein [Burkholderia cenocepacia]|uniref:hypothetical protein n=1 Tax=Burkholderia cenocepacia TaxID=95486 RepID=UPI00223265D9|nr:hypothetical protein [Burkholderia cenocepacia]MCW3539335.1 hypothetical protein [Burkholderia cenocepacia]
MRLPSFNLGQPANIATLVAALQRALGPIVKQLNALSDGQLAATNNAAAGPPGADSLTTYARGDFIRNALPEELGNSGSRYTVRGWVCIEAGKPGQWREERCLTGN